MSVFSEENIKDLFTRAILHGHVNCQFADTFIEELKEERQRAQDSKDAIGYIMQTHEATFLKLRIAELESERVVNMINKQAHDNALKKVAYLLERNESLTAANEILRKQQKEQK